MHRNASIERTQPGRPPAMPMTNDQRLQLYLRRAADFRTTAFNNVFAQGRKK